MGKSLHKAGRRIKTKEEFDKEYGRLIDEREEAIHRLISIQFEIDELFEKDYDLLFNKKCKGQGE